ncbi:MAG: C25 family cysteine peptidase, partial [candidate division Zixibacteria bacterium]|nr:C25 family cysteine peptidase [candidate division Zixibacteria bacterium]
MLDDNESSLRMQVEVGALEFTPVTTDRGVFMLATVKGLTQSQRIGEPNLPTANRLLSIPYGCDLTVEVEKYSVEEYSLADYGITDPIIPVQPSLSKSQQPGDVPFEFNDVVYASAGYYALPLATAEPLGEMRGLRIGRLSVAPIQYDPVAKKIKVYKDITVRVDYKNADWTATYEGWDRYYSPYFESVYNRIANYRTPTADKNDMTKYPVKYVIVSHRMFEAQLQPFIEWKTQKGFTVVTAYTDVIGTTNTAIKTYLHTLYDAGTAEDPAPSFVLLVGDAQQVPPFDEGDHFSDLRLCEFTGDYFPEIYYGRFSAQTTAELQPQIDKTLEYEKYLMPDPSYLGEVTLVSGADANYAPTYGNGQINYGTNLYFNAAHGITPNVWLYPASGGAVEAAVKQTINDGVGLANYTAHCGHEGWGDPSFTTTDIASLTNNHKWLLAINNCCQAHTFGTDYSTPCFGELWLQSANKGGMGSIGGTNSTYWDEDYWWGVGNGPIVGSGATYEQTGLGAYDGMFHDHGEALTDYYVANDALIYCGNLAVTEAGSSRTEYYWEIYCLMGDPSLMTYLGVPLVNSASYPATLVLSEPSITVSAVSGSYVGISMNGELHGQAYIGTSGSATISLTPFATPGVADIVITAQNKQPVIGTIQVITPNGPYVIYDGSALDDQTGGNGNGLVDYGESVTLDMQAKNVGPDEAVSVTGQLTTADSYVTITDDMADFGTIPGENGTSEVLDAYAFKIQSSVPDGHIIPFSVAMTDAADSTWNSNFTMVAHAPAVEYVSVVVGDVTGNMNGVLDPGETVSILISLKNDGSGQADDVAGILTEDDLYLSIDDESGTFGTLAPEG